MKIWEVACEADCSPESACVACESHNDYNGYWGE